MAKSKSVKELPPVEDVDKGYHCLHCGSYVKRYRRKINCNMALVLITLVRKKRTGFVPIEEFMRVNGYHRCGDFSYLVHWGLLEKMTGERPDGSKSNGFYKITDKGQQFAKKQITVQQTLLITHGKCEGFEGPQVDILVALGSRFDYLELMKGVSSSENKQNKQSTIKVTPMFNV